MKSFMEYVESENEYNMSKSLLSLHFDKCLKEKNCPLSNEIFLFLRDFYVSKYIPKEDMYSFAKYFRHVCLDIFSSSWVEADNASQMNSTTGPRSHMGVALSCKATTNLANLRMKRNDQEFSKSMAST